MEYHIPRLDQSSDELQVPRAPDAQSALILHSENDTILGAYLLSPVA
jgi:hypothetical protein